MTVASQSWWGESHSQLLRKHVIVEVLLHSLCLGGTVEARSWCVVTLWRPKQGQQRFLNCIQSPHFTLLCPCHLGTCLLWPALWHHHPTMETALSESPRSQLWAFPVGVKWPYVINMLFVSAHTEQRLKLCAQQWWMKTPGIPCQSCLG